MVASVRVGTPDDFNVIAFPSILSRLCFNLSVMCRAVELHRETTDPFNLPSSARIWDLERIVHRPRLAAQEIKVQSIAVRNSKLVGRQGSGVELE